MDSDFYYLVPGAVMDAGGPRGVRWVGFIELHPEKEWSQEEAMSAAEDLVEQLRALRPHFNSEEV